MLIIGLTGGIGSGKSTVAGYFAQQGIPVIDADQLARELVAPGSPALNEITGIFGPDILFPDGSLDRARLRSRVFADPALRRAIDDYLKRERAYVAAAGAELATMAPFRKDLIIGGE